MIPIRATDPSKNYPLATYGIIVVNVLVFLLQLSHRSDIERFYYFYGLVPARYTVSHIAAYFSTPQQALPFLSFMFLHGGIWHLVSNMLFLHVFGDKIENRLGVLRYLCFYLLCGVTSGASHMLLNLTSNTPIIGASGAIAGVMGAYFILYPRSKILTLVPIIIIPFFFEIPAFFFLALWLLLQFLNALGSQPGLSGVAWWAHIGGFVFGILFLKLFNVVPHLGLSDTIRAATRKKTTYRLQVIRPEQTAKDANLYGTITISPYEAFAGTQKVINIPWGFHTRLFQVTIPPGLGEGRQLRLKGQGQPTPDGGRGDLYLKVLIRDYPLE
jgi:membrane associated rhomboid family serine protease